MNTNPAIRPDNKDPLHPEALVTRGMRRWLYVLLGMCFTFLAILGAVLPVLPTTPFLILASYFFVRSSPALNARLLRSRIFGPMLRDWQKYRGVRLHIKVIVMILIPLMVTASIILGELPLWLTILVIVLGLIGLYVVLRLPVVRNRTIHVPVPLQPDVQPVRSGEAT